jgi:hypothetical protein
MKSRLGGNRPRINLKGRLAFLALTLLLVAVLFFSSILLPPLAAPVHALNPPPAVATQAPGASGVNGTLASFTALIPESLSVYLPSIIR